MKKISIFLLAIGFVNCVQGQLTNSLNINTGYDNVSNTTLPNGVGDADWQVINLTSPFAPPPGSSTPYPAITQNPWTTPAPAPTTPSNTKWISYNTTSMSIGPYDNTGGTVTFLYTVKTCGNDTITIQANINCDNAATISVDGIPQSFTSNNWAGATFAYNQFWVSGTHTIEITVQNATSIAPNNPVGLNVQGTISSIGNSIIDIANYPNYVCYTPTSSSCNDSCYWKVTGNTILGGNNYFGTNSNDDISIGTNSMLRGIIKSGNASTGGYFGLNTTNPTARLHIDCNAGNSASGTSDVRFENLESGDGYLLAINSLGYVLKTSQTSMTPTNYWNVFGNAASPYGNFLGTNNAVDVILRTNNIDKGIWTSGTSGAPGDDGRLGWQTLNPTAHLHINCAGGNPDDGSTGSDVRFEALEPGRGNILVIDDEGYVYNSGKPLDAYKSAANEAKIEKLEKEVEELKAQIETLLNPTNQSKREAAVDQNQLFPNTPNPFGKETKIEFYIHDMMQSASITINDLNGRMLKSYPINQKGMGSILVTGDDMTPGIYLYSLVIDGREINTKRMILSK